MTPLQFEDACNVLGSLLGMLCCRYGRSWEFSEAAPSFEVGDPLYRLVAADAMPGPLPIWPGGCEGTIYGAGELGRARNGMFRAWHDSVHLTQRCDFTPEGEALVALTQCSQVRTVMEELGYMPAHIAHVQTVLMGEIVGQLDYLQAHGEFPTDQVACVAAYCGVQRAAA